MVIVTNEKREAMLVLARRYLPQRKPTDNRHGITEWHPTDGNIVAISKHGDFHLLSLQRKCDLNLEKNWIHRSSNQSPYLVVDQPVWNEEKKDNDRLSKGFDIVDHTIRKLASIRCFGEVKKGLRGPIV